MPSRREVVEIARSWIGTRFLHQGRTRPVKSNGKLIGGIDCAGLIVVVGHESGLLDPSVDVPAYRRIPDGRTIREMLAKHAIEIPFRDLQPADIVAVKWEGSRFPHHLGIISDLSRGRLGMIHSYFDFRRVVESGFVEPWISRTVSAHTWPGLERVPWVP